jgi:DNA-binding CsgD family transcriptional regulator
MLIADTDAQTQELHLTRHGDSVRVAIRPQHRSGYGWETHDLCFYLTDVSSEVNVSESSLSGIYGLTPREARITKLLVRGRTVDEITQQEHITKNTAYTHIKSVFSKVGVSQQSALVSRIVASPVILG